jgi:hypothetical protein
MLRRSHILTTAALLAAFAVPASAAPYEELRSDGAAPNGDVAPPPSSIAAPAADEYQDLRSPDAVDAARDRPSVPAATHGPGFTEAERRLVESQEVQAMIDRARSEIRATPAVVEVDAPSGFDWADAGIGAAGMLALVSIAAGSALMLTGRKRGVATH